LPQYAAQTFVHTYAVISKMNFIKSPFRYDINALRAIAVLSVIFYHYQFPFLSGGFAGVDIFFVISGFLMSKLILTGLEKQVFSYPAFLWRRIQRIVPALLFLILLVSLTGFLIYFPWDLKASSINALGSLFFYSNILYLHTASYFDASSALNIYLHTWSLSVEFQFYLLYPLLLIGLHTVINQKPWQILTIGLLTISFFTMSVILTTTQPIYSFYLLPSRSWELLAGAMVFLLGNFKPGRLVRQIFAGAGYLILGAGLVLLDSKLPWPGYYTAIPVLGTSVIIIADYNDGAVFKNQVIQFFGKISYSLYLWHWPVYVFSQYLGFDNSVIVKLSLIALSIMLAFLSYTFIEQKKISYKTLVIAFASMGAFLLIGSQFQINRFIFKKLSLEIAEYENTHMSERNQQFSEGKCFLSKGKFADFDKAFCLHLQAGRKNLLLIGDSHGAELSQSLKKALSLRGINLIQATASGCLPLVRNYGLTHCTKLIDYIYRDFILKNKEHIDGIILSANWARGHYDKAVLFDDLDNTITYLNKYNFKIILLGQTEVYRIPYPYIAAREIQFHLKSSKNYRDPQVADLNKLLQKTFFKYYVPIYTDESPDLLSGGIPYFFDENHLTKYGADLATTKILAHPLTKKIL